MNKNQIQRALVIAAHHKAPNRLIDVSLDGTTLAYARELEKGWEIHNLGEELSTLDEARPYAYALAKLQTHVDILMQYESDRKSRTEGDD